MQFLGIPYHPRQLDSEHHQRSFFRSVKGHARLGASINAQSVNQWKSILSTSEKDVFTSIAGKQLDAHGYEV